MPEDVIKRVYSDLQKHYNVTNGLDEFREKIKDPAVADRVYGDLSKYYNITNSREEFYSRMMGIAPKPVPRKYSDAPDQRGVPFSEEAKERMREYFGAAEQPEQKRVMMPSTGAPAATTRTGILDVGRKPTMPGSLISAGRGIGRFVASLPQVAAGGMEEVGESLLEDVPFGEPGQPGAEVMYPNVEPPEWMNKMDEFRRKTGRKIAAKGREIGESNMKWVAEHIPPGEGGEKIIEDIFSGGASAALSIGLYMLTKNPKASMIVFGIMAKTRAYSEARRAGKTPEQARGISTVRGLSEAALEGIGLHFIFKRFANPFIAALGRATAESLQEGAQSLAEAGIMTATGVREWEGNETLRKILGEAFYEASIGFIVGAGGSVAIQRSQLIDAGIPEAAADKMLEKITKDAGQFVDEMSELITPEELDKISKDLSKHDRNMYIKWWNDAVSQDAVRAGRAGEPGRQAVLSGLETMEKEGLEQERLGEAMAEPMGPREEVTREQEEYDEWWRSQIEGIRGRRAGEAGRQEVLKGLEEMEKKGIEELPGKMRKELSHVKRILKNIDWRAQKQLARKEVAKPAKARVTIETVVEEMRKKGRSEEAIKKARNLHEKIIIGTQPEAKFNNITIDRVDKNLIPTFDILNPLSEDYESSVTAERLKELGIKVPIIPKGQMEESQKYLDRVLAEEAEVKEKLPPLPDFVQAVVDEEKMIYAGVTKDGDSRFIVPRTKRELVVGNEEMATRTKFARAVRDHFLYEGKTKQAREVPLIQRKPKRERGIFKPKPIGPTPTQEKAHAEREAEFEKYHPEEIVVGNLEKGDKFKIRGEDYEVKVDESGRIVIEDGDTYELDEFDKIPVDEGKIKKERVEKPTTKEPNEMTREEYSERTIAEIGRLKSKIKKAPYGTEKTDMERRLNNLEVSLDFENKYHESAIRKALKEGKIVPPEVLKDYPDLVKPAEAKPAPTAKQPWEMTSDEYLSTAKSPISGEKIIPDRHKVHHMRANHKAAVEKALSEGKTVPAEVLADYPDLINGVEAAVKKYMDAELRPGEGESGILGNYVKSFIRPLLGRIEKSPWADTDVYEKGAHKKTGGIGKDLSKLGKHGILQTAYDREGMPHRALRGVPIPDNMLSKDVIEDLEKRIGGIETDADEKRWQEEFDRLLKEKTPAPAKAEAPVEKLTYDNFKWKVIGSLTNKRNLGRGGDYYNKLLKQVSDEDLDKVRRWATSSDNRMISRFITQYVIAEQRERAKVEPKITTEKVLESQIGGDKEIKNILSKYRGDPGEMFGKSAVIDRQRIIELLTGRKPPKAKAGVTVVRSLVFKHVGVKEGTTLRDRVTEVQNWIESRPLGKRQPTEKVPGERDYIINKLDDYIKYWEGEVKEGVSKANAERNLDDMKKFKRNYLSNKLTKDQNGYVTQWEAEYRDDIRTGKIVTEKIPGAKYEQIVSPELLGQAKGPKGKIKPKGEIKPIEGGEGVGFFKREAPETGELFTAQKRNATTKDKIKFTRGGKTYVETPYKVDESGAAYVDLFGLKKIERSEYEIVGEEGPLLKENGIEYYLENQGVENVKEATEQLKMEFDKIQEVSDKPYGEEAVLRGLATKEEIEATLGKGGIVSAIEPMTVKELPDVGSLIGKTINSPREFATLMMPLRSPYFESSKLAYADKNGKILFATVHTVGSLSASVIDPVEITSLAPEGTETVYVAHNHPSGKANPSADDKTVTEVVRRIVTEAGFEWGDHIITDGGEFYLFSEEKTYQTDEYFEHKAEKVPPGKLKRVHKPADFKEYLDNIKQGNPKSKHIIYVSVNNSIVGVQRILGDVDSVTKQAARNMRRLGAMGVLLDAGDTPGSQLGNLKKNFQNLGMVLLDIHTDKIPSFADSSNPLAIEAMLVTEPGEGYGKVEDSEPGPARSGGTVSPSVAFKEVKERPIVRAFDHLLKIAAPGRRSEVSAEGARIIRTRTAQLAQQKVADEKELRKARRAFNFMSRENTIDFEDRMENGVSQRDAKLNAIANKFRSLLDGRRDKIRALGKGYLQNYIENYFPHAWKNPKKASSAIAAILGKRPLAGRKAFLKKRTVMTVKEGIERGLEPLSWNPADQVLYKLHEMDRFIMAQDIIKDLKSRGLIKFKYARSKMPEGYLSIDDSSFKVYMPPEMTTKEAYDQVMVDDLMAFAQSMDIDAKRLMKLRRRTWWGYAQGMEKVRTKFAGPESVLIHEIGHIIGNRYNLYEWMSRPPGKVFKTGERKGQEIKADARRERVLIADELRALADERYRGDTTDYFKKYVRKAEEKEAVMLEAYLHAPEMMEKVAPNVYERFVEYLNSRTELRPLLDIKPSVVLGVGEGKMKIPGVTKLGDYVAPEPVALLLNNYLSKGLRKADNVLISGAYDLTRKTANTLNFVNLSLSMFHALNTTSDVMNTTLGLGFRQVFATKGQTLRGLGHIAMTPVSPFVNVWKGHQLKKLMEQDLKNIQNPVDRENIKNIIMAGGRSKMDAHYHNMAARALVDTFTDIARGTIEEKAKGVAKFPILSLTSAIEISAKPVMEHLVPRQKLGAFYMLAKHEMLRAKAGQITEEQLWERLTQSWDNVDNRMGQLVYDNLFWNKTMKDSLMMAIRSVGWNLGSWREFGGAPIDFITTKKRIRAGDVWMSQKMAYTMAAVINYSIMGAVLTFLLTGKGPEEWKDYMFPKTGKKNPDGSDERLSLPTYAKDWYAWSQRPFVTAAHKMHPIWSMVSDMLRNEDFYGTEIINKDDPIMRQLIDELEFMGKTMLPFSVKNYLKMTSQGREPLPAAATSITGIITAPAYVTRTHAQKLATEYMVARLPRGSRTTEQYTRSQKRKQLQLLARSGKDIHGHPLAKDFTDGDVRRIIREAAEEPFALSFKRLTLEEALNVYAVSNPKERNQVKEILIGKFERSPKNENPDIKALFDELIPDFEPPRKRRARVRRKPTRRKLR